MGCFRTHRRNKASNEEEKSKDIIHIASRQTEPDLLDEMYYCGSQLIYIGVFVAVIAMIIVLLLYTCSYGRPKKAAIEFIIALVFDQAKAFVAQPIVPANWRKRTSSSGTSLCDDLAPCRSWAGSSGTTRKSRRRERLSR